MKRKRKSNPLTFNGDCSVKLGGNYYINVPNMIVAYGESLFRLVRREDGVLGIDFDIYDPDGLKIATIRNGNVVQGNKGNYKFTKSHHHYQVIEKKTQRVICDIKKISQAEEGCELEICVDLYTKTGFHVIASPQSTNIGVLSMSGCSISNVPNGLVIR